MTFPTPEGWDEDDSDDIEAGGSESSNDKPPEFGDSMTSNQLQSAIVEYQEWCNDHYDVLDVDLSGFPSEVSHKMKRTAGKVAHKKGIWEVTYVRYAYKAYQKWGWEKFAETIRHELIHVHTVQNLNEGGHGPSFKRMVEPMETHRHCEKFAEDEAKYLLYCSECGEQVGQRFKKSKTVKQPGRYNSKCCKADLKVERNR